MNTSIKNNFTSEKGENETIDGHNNYSVIFILTGVIILICLICLVYMYIVKFRKFDVNSLFTQSAELSTFQPTNFTIYDKSSKDKCNRLIVVNPFGWYIWACNGELYIINAENGISCPTNSTPAVRILRDHFTETCLNLHLDSILNAYIINTVPVVVPYEITTTTFTILSALNILMKKYITFDETVEQNSQFKIVQRDDGNDYGPVKMKRILTESHLIAFTTPKSLINSKQLHKMYKIHAKTHLYHHRHTDIFDDTLNAKGSIYFDGDKTKLQLGRLDKNHGSYITKRQHIDANDQYRPKIMELN